MSLVTSLALGFSLSIDSCVAATARSAGRARPRLREAFLIAFLFAASETAILAAGWVLGEAVGALVVRDLVQDFDHWIAFALLLFVGLRMIREGLAGRAESSGRPIELGRLAVTAVATSIDAAAVGFGIAFMPVPPLEVAAAVGGVTFVLAATGVMMGRFLGAVLAKRAEILGGAVLIAVGIRIVVEHMTA